MQIVVTAEDKKWEELINSAGPIEWIRVPDAAGFSAYTTADAFMDLAEDAATKDYTAIAQPVFINSVVTTLQKAALPKNIFRINGWSTFLNRPVWEIAGEVNENIISIIEQTGKKINPVADEPGFVAARIVSMIVNEAYFALGDEVSSKSEIDTAMKLGTNYPHGPFEWAEKIGVQHIHLLLKKLNTTDNRYLPAPLLVQEALQTI
jgi:3-hydroxybutyryl-CoA dehydrogenase